MSNNVSGKNRIQNKKANLENKISEEVLSQNENQLRLVTDAIPALVAYVDREHRYRFVNRKYFEWFGQEPSEIIGKHLLEVIGDKAYSSLLPQIEKVFAGEKFTYEQLVNYRMVGKRYVQIDFLPDFEPDGKTVKGYYALIQDIDERKRRESNIKFLAEIAEDFARLLTADEIMKVVGEKIGKYLNVGSCLFTEINESADIAIVQSTWNANQNLPDTIGVHKLSEFVTEEFQAAARRGEIIAIKNTQTDERTDAESYATFNVHSFVTVPFRRAGEWKFLFSVHDIEPRDWSKDELELIREVSSRTFPRIERAIAEAALRESEERLQLAMKIAETATWEVDLVNNRTYWSESHFTMLGIKPTPNREATTEMWQNALLPEDLPKLLAEWERAEREHDTFFSEHRIRRTDNGKTIWVNAAGRFFYNDEGKAVRFVGIFHDISRRKRAEETLRESEERLRLATNAAAMFSWETDVAAQKIKWSENTAEIIGCAPEDLPNHTDHGQFFVLPEDRKIIDYEFQQVLKEGKSSFVCEFRGNSPEEKYWEAQNLIIYDEAKNPLRVVGFTQNITARKRAEKERELLLESERLARHEAENANRLKDEFLATVSHELRTPLNAILGWSTIARKNPSDSETSARALEIIERSARQQNQIIADILDVSRIITGKLHLNILPVNLADVINSAIETVRPTLDAKRIKLDTIFDPNATFIQGDANRLQQIIWNLLTNATKFTEANGQILIILRGDGEFVTLTVTDNGIGIEPEFLPFVFDRFRQADGGTSRKHGGLGLGLAIVRHLTEAHGGSVGVESLGKGNGASFSVRFPLNIFENKTAEKEILPNNLEVKTNEKSVVLLQGIRVLLVDDEIDSLDLAATILKAKGAIVITADSAENALRKLKHNIPDIIISDIGMPEKSGFDLIREIRQTYGSKVPAIALTAYARPEDKRQVIEAGFDLHFPKPIEADLFVSAVKKFF